jgi:hypothetical protein
MKEVDEKAVQAIMDSGKITEEEAMRLPTRPSFRYLLLWIRKLV